jgi:glucosamine-6-phosphate deaminase
MARRRAIADVHRAGRRPRVKCRTFPTELELASALARVLVDTIRRLPGVVMGLPTGRTPLALYAELIRITRDEDVDWSDVKTFNLDEFVSLGARDPGSYHTFMQERLFAHVNLRPEHIGFLNGRADDLDAECERYERAIRAAGGIDVLVLGIGANGHIGFNEPAEELIAHTHRVSLVEPTRAANALWFGGNVSRVPREALTMGLSTILAARSIVLIATGEAKEEAVSAMLYGNVTTRVPASFLQLHAQVSVMLDEPAANASQRDH